MTAPAPGRNQQGKWLIGQSGNPAGRPRGSRNRLSEAFFDDLYAAWKRRGAEAIERTIDDQPAVFIKVIASLIPKEMLVRNDPLEEISNAELADLLDQIRAAKAQLIADQSGEGAIAAPAEDLA